MRRTAILIMAALGFAVALGAKTTHAQDVIGVSFRPTDAMPPGTASGTADVKSADGGYTVSADFSGIDELDLADFEGASAFVVWGVDMSSEEHYVGALNSDKVLTDAAIDYLPSGFYLSAESSSSPSSREGDILFSFELRKPSEAGAATATGEASPSATEAMAATATPADTSAAPPKDLPTTGQLVRDLLVLAALGFALLVGGMKLRQVRI